MKVAVLDRQTPFRCGDGEALAARLCEALREHGHASELIRIPFRSDRPATVVDQMLAARLVHLDNVDRAVALRFPAYLLAHDRRVVWLPPRHDGRHDSLPADVRTAVRAAQRAHLGEAARLHARSALAARALARDSGLDAGVLYAPLPEADYRCERYGDQLLALADVAVTAGLCVALAALARSQTPARLLVACAAQATQPLLELARALGVEGRIELAEAPAGSAAWIALLAGARAVVATEHDCEDLTREAFQARKAVIALADCGCVPGLVRDGVSGRVATTLDELAAAFDELSQDAALAERLGTGALDTLSALEVSWETVVSELTR